MSDLLPDCFSPDCRDSRCECDCHNPPPVDSVAGPMLTIPEVAEMARVSRMTIYRLVHAGELPAVRVGRQFRVPENVVRAYLARPAAERAEATA